MKAADVVLEFVVTGSVGLLVIVLLTWTVGVQTELVAQFPDDPFSKAIAGVLALPGIYYLGIVVHHASWWLWRKQFHRRLFKQVFKSERAKAQVQHISRCEPLPRELT